MSEELVSALLDGECDGRELDRLLAECERDEALRTRFSRMQYARDLARSPTAVRFDAGFADRVMSALAAIEPDAAGGKVVPLVRKRPAWVPVGGIAAAASLVLAVVAGVMLSAGRDVSSASEKDDGYVAVAPPSAVALTDPDQPAPTAAVVPVASMPQTSLSRGAAELRWAQIEGEQARQLNHYLIDYSNYRSAQGVGGTLGYARFAAHTADYRPQDE